MSRSFATAAAAAILALAPSVMAGSLVINNHCGQNVYMFANEGFNQTSEMMTLTPGGSNYNVPYAGQSICVKIHSDPDPGSANTELEYSAIFDSNTLFYDLSNIVGYPQLFEQNGITITPSSGNCPTINCPPGVSPCTSAYNNWDDTATLSCDTGSDLVMDLCSSMMGSGAPAPAPQAPSSTVAPSTAPAPTSAAPSHAYSAPAPVAPVVNAVASAAPKASSSAPAPAAPATSNTGHALQVGPGGIITEAPSQAEVAQAKNAVSSKDVAQPAEDAADGVLTLTTFTTVTKRAEATPAPVQRRHVHHHHHAVHAEEQQ